MRRRALLACGVAVLLVLPGCVAAAVRQTPARHAAPKLIVQLVIDQMRADYPARYGAQWTKGLHRLVTAGAYFSEARFPHAGNVTCAGHASIGAGAVPSVHGMVLNEWWDRQARQRTPCTADRTVTPIGFTKSVTGGYSARAMLAETFAERLRASQPGGVGRVVSLSLKPRSAITLAGKRGDAVVWFEGSGTFATSSAYDQPAWLSAYLKATPIETALRSQWTRALDASSYQGNDAAPGQLPPAGWTPVFPHTLSDTGVADAGFYDRWQRSPFSDDYLTGLAIAAIDAMSLGRGAGTDYLAVSYSALDLVGHRFGPGSHEVQDLLIRTDASIGRLLDHLDAKVGAGNYVLALSSDHGVGDIPEASGGRGGRLPRGLVVNIIEEVLDTAWGDGVHVEHDLYTDIYLTGAALARLTKEPATLAALRQRLEPLPSVLRMLTAADIERARESKDPMMRAVLLSYHPSRSGDLIILLREHHTTSIDAASHSTYYDYDRHVPVILFGSAFKAGTYGAPASPLDIAATWSRLTGVALDRPHGRSLDAAVK